MRKVQIIPNYFVTADVRNRSSGGLVRFVALRKKSHRTGYFELTMIARFTTENAPFFVELRLALANSHALKGLVRNLRRTAKD